MNNLERIRNEITTILLLIITLAFTTSNLTPEVLEHNSLEHNSLAERLPLTEAIN